MGGDSGDPWERDSWRGNRAITIHKTPAGNELYNIWCVSTIYHRL